MQSFSFEIFCLLLICSCSLNTLLIFHWNVQSLFNSNLFKRVDHFWKWFWLSNWWNISRIFFIDFWQEIIFLIFFKWSTHWNRWQILFRPCFDCFWCNFNFNIIWNFSVLINIVTILINEIVISIYFYWFKQLCRIFFVKLNWFLFMLLLSL